MTERLPPGDRGSELPATPSMVPPLPPRTRLGAVLRVAGWTVVGVLIALASLAASLAYHLRTTEARSLARVTIEDLASDALRGDLDIGRIDELTLGRARFTDVVLYDDQRRMVISIPELTVWPDLDELWSSGTIRVAGAYARNPFVQLYTVDEIGAPDPDGLEVSLVRAFQPSQPGDPNGTPVHIVLDHLQLDHATVIGDAPRFPGLVVQELDVLGRIEIEREVLIQVFDAHGRMTAPYAGDTSLDRAVVRFSTDWEQGLDAYVIAHREGSRAEARVQVTRAPTSPPEAPPHVWIRAHFDPLEMATLSAMELTPDGALIGRVRGHAILEGPSDALELHAFLETDGGPLAVEGTLASDGHYRFAAHAEGLELDAVVARVPPMLLRGDASIALDTSSGELAPPRVTLDLAPLSVEGYALPALRGEGRIEDDAVYIDTIAAPDLTAGAGGEISGTGRIGFDGALALELTLDVDDIGRDPNVVRLLPGAHGAIAGSLRVLSGPLAADLAYDFDVDIRDLRYGPVSARRLLARGFLRGDLSRPVTRITTSGDGLRTGSLALGHFSGSVHGGPTQYELALAVQGGAPVRAARIAAVARAVGDGSFDLTTDAFEIDPGVGRYVQSAPLRVRVGAAGARFDAFALHGATAAPSDGAAPGVVVGGAVGPRRADALVVQVTAFPLDTLAPLLGDGFAHLGGRLGGTLEVDGALDAPRVSVRGAIDDLSFDRVRAASVSYDIAHADGVLTTRIEGTLGDRGTMLLDGPVEIPFAALGDVDRWMHDARFQGVRVAVDQVGVPFLLPLLGVDTALYDVSGKVSMSGELLGTLEHPQVPSFVLILDRISPEGWTPLRVKLELALADRSLAVRRLWIADVDGEIALAEGHFVLPLDAMPADRAGWVAGIAREPWELALRLEPRLLEEWPRPLSKSLPRGVRFAGSLGASGGPDGARARFDGSLQWQTPTFDSPCSRREQPVLQIVAETEPIPETHDDHHRRTRVVGTMFADQRSIATATLTASTPLDAWLARGELPAPPETLLAVVLDEVPLGRVPWTCPRASGRANGQATVTLFSERPSVDLDVDVDELRIRDEGAQASQPYHVAVRAHAEGADWTDLAACAVVTEESAERTAVARCPLRLLDVARDGTVTVPDLGIVVPLEGEAIVRAAVPIRFSRESLVPEVAIDRAVLVDGRFSEAHLEPLLVAVPGISQADAIGDGEVQLRALDGAVQLSGGLAIEQGRARILALGQHLYDIEGLLRFRGNRIVIDEDHQLRASDPAGRVALDGEIGFEGLSPAWADVHVFPDGFPFRREGAVLASLAGHAGLRVRFEDDRLTGQIRTSSFAVQLPDRMAGSVMQLEGRRDVLVIGEDAYELTSTSGTPYPYILHLDATEPFRVYRNDFEAELTAELDIEYADPELTVTGSAQLRSGTFEVFGKRFAITRGSLLFLEERPLDPVIDLVATYALPGRSGASISIEVGGQLSDMAIAFTSTETSDVGQILSLLVAGSSSRSTEETAQQAGGQAANFVAGLTAGLLTLTLRRELGDVGNVVPAVSIETAGTAGTLRARAYWDASMIIPDFLREVVVGASVEGFFTADQASSGGGSAGSTGAGGGVTIELQFPYGLRSTGTYVPPQSWGADVLWQP